MLFRRWKLDRLFILVERKGGGGGEKGKEDEIVIDFVSIISSIFGVYFGCKHHGGLIPLVQKTYEDRRIYCRETD